MCMHNNNNAKSHIIIANLVELISVFSVELVSCKAGEVLDSALAICSDRELSTSQAFIATHLLIIPCDVLFVNLVSCGTLLVVAGPDSALST